MILAVHLYIYHDLLEDEYINIEIHRINDIVIHVDRRTL